MTQLLAVDNLSKRFGGFVALDGISISVNPGERVGLIGPNGSGKSTLVNCICGTLQNEAGSVRFDGHLIDGATAHQRTRRGLARTFQLPRPFASLSLADNMRIPLLYTVAAPATRRTISRRGASTFYVRWVSTAKPIGFRANSPRLKCASSNSPAPWRRSRSF
jgi:ABC-type branched-subunit amino acid transport system ATPase component